MDDFDFHLKQTLEEMWISLKVVSLDQAWLLVKFCD